MKSKIWSKEEISTFCLELSLLLKAGLPAEVCFSILCDEETDAAKKQVLMVLYKKVADGESTYTAMTQTGVFPDYMMKMVMMGEETGYLDMVFHALSKYYEERCKTEQALKETVIFPLVLFFMMLIVVVVLMTEVLPVFQNVFAQLGGTMSPVALFFLNIGVAMKKGRIVFLIICTLIIAGAVVIALHEETRKKWNSFWMEKYVCMEAGKLYESSHFASAIHMGITGGLDSDRALELAEGFCEKNMKDRISACRNDVMMGVPIAEAIEKQKLLKPMYCRMLSIGVKTGSLDSALEAISCRTEEEASAAMQKLVSKVEPAVVIILCVVVGVMLLSVMFPLIGIMNSLG